MPELPEVEITRLGILKRVGGRRCTGAVVRETRFRKSAPRESFRTAHGAVSALD